jgi:hypothetical protein
MSPTSALIIDFESTPNLPLGPSFFSSAGPAQNIVVGGVTVKGGVVLGLPSFLPASIFSTTPNLYGTANHPSGGAVGDSSLQSMVSIEIDPSLGISTVEGLLVNGLIGEDNFTIEAYSGLTLVDSLFLIGISANVSSGYEVFKLDSGGLAIDLVTLRPSLDGPFSGEWDYFLDTLAIGEPIENVIRVAEPASIALLLAGIGCLMGMARRGEVLRMTSCAVRRGRNKSHERNMLGTVV